MGLAHKVRVANNDEDMSPLSFTTQPSKDHDRSSPSTS